MHEAPVLGQLGQLLPELELLPLELEDEVPVVPLEVEEVVEDPPLELPEVRVEPQMPLQCPNVYWQLFEAQSPFVPAPLHVQPFA